MKEDKRVKPPKLFVAGSKYRVTNYITDRVSEVEILSRKETWCTILLDGVKKEVRVYPVSNPLSESILMDDYSPIFSYNSLNHYGENEEEEPY